MIKSLVIIPTVKTSNILNLSTEALSGKTKHSYRIFRVFL
jgi:hypothetical protein